MRVVLLCGGKGLRFNGGEHPKCLAEVHGVPLIRHVMAMYEPLCPDFHLLLGHRGDDIRLHFAARDYASRSIGGLVSGVKMHETGRDTQTGGRLRRWREWFTIYGDGGTFAVTYSDGVADLDMHALLAFHETHGKLATVTAVPARSKFGVLQLDGERVTTFREKPPTSDWISAGFFLFEPRAFEFMNDGPLEEEPMRRLVEADELRAFRHDGFFACVDSHKDLDELNAMPEPLPWTR